MGFFKIALLATIAIGGEYARPPIDQVNNRTADPNEKPVRSAPVTRPAGIDTTCEIWELCGNINGPSGEAAFIADFAWVVDQEEFAALEVGGG